MKFVVAVSIEIEIESENENLAAELGYTLLNGRVPTELVVSNSKGKVQRIKLDPEKARVMRHMGRASSEDDED